MVHSQNTFAKELIVLGCFVYKAFFHLFNIRKRELVLFNSNIPINSVDQSLGS
jgi:hypothetical protein